MKAMDDDEMLEYLKELDTKYTERNMTYFWAMCDNETFKPMKKYSDRQIEAKFMKNPERYKGRWVANIKVYIDNTKHAVKQDDSLIDVIYNIFKVKNNGEIDFDGRAKTLRALYFKDDLNKRKFKSKDIEKFMKLCYEGVLRSDVLNGKPFKLLMKELKKKKIDFSDV
jgi:hypothetical protein